MLQMRSSSPKCLYLLDDPSKDKHVHYYVLEGLKTEGNETLVGYFYGGTEDSQLAKAGFPVVSLGLTKKDYTRFKPSTVRKLRCLIQRQGITAIHCHRYRTVVNAGLARIGTTVSVLLYTVAATGTLRHFHRRVVFNRLCKGIDRVLAVSNGVRDDLLENASRLSREKITVLHLGIDLNAYQTALSKQQARRVLDLPEGAFLFGIVARLKKAKAHNILLQSFARFLGTGHPAYLVIAGGGPLEQEVQGLSRQLNIDDRTIFLGHRPAEQIPTVLKALDAFVHPSFREGLPLAILEAMSARLPVISTNSEGVTDIFEGDQRFGYMSPRGDVQKLTESMVRMYCLPESERKTLGEAARARVAEEFSREHTVKRTVDVYKQLFREKHLGYSTSEE